MHGTTLHRGETELVNFLIQTNLTPDQCNNLQVIYDELSLNINSIQIRTYKFQTIVSVSITPKEIGSLRIGFEIPKQSLATGYHLRKIPLPLVKIPYSRFQKLTS
jgi:hypothetical protein